MSTLILRGSGAVVAVVGLVGVVLGGWFLDALGTSGSATFTAEPGQRVVVLEPDVLNRVDSPVEVTASASGEVWAATARPSDVDAVLQARRATATGVDVSEWALTTKDVGEGDPDGLRNLGIWQSTMSADASVTTTIEQENAPQTLVITAPQGQQVDELEFEVTDARWGTSALTVLVVGAVLILVGLALALVPWWRSRRGRPTTEEA